MMKIIVKIYLKANNLIERGIPISEIRKIGFFVEYPKLKNDIANIEMAKIDEKEEEYIKKLEKIEEDYKIVNI